MERLTGTWEGVLVGLGAASKISIRFKGDTLRFQGLNAAGWNEVSCTVIEGTSPQQPRATITECERKKHRAETKLSDGGERRPYPRPALAELAEVVAAGRLDPASTNRANPTPMNDSFAIRLATTLDRELLATHRVAMFRDMGRTTPEIEPPLLAACVEYLGEALERGEYVGWVAELRDTPHSAVGGAGVQLRPLLPRTDPRGTSLLLGREGLVLNVYVEPEFRRRGIARQLMETVIRWAPGAGIVRLVLHASADGRPLYEQLGFLESNEMLFPPFATPGNSSDS